MAVDNGKVLGFAYGNWFKPRPAYRYSVEDSIYLATYPHSKGLGRAFLAELIAHGKAIGLCKAMAILGCFVDTGHVSVALALGFEQVGKVDTCGWKFGAQRDIVIMQKTFGLGDTELPAGRLH